MKRLADLIFERIKHGDETHKQWLRDKSYEIAKEYTEVCTNKEGLIEYMPCPAHAGIPFELKVGSPLLPQSIKKVCPHCVGYLESLGMM